VGHTVVARNVGVAGSMALGLVTMLTLLSRSS